MDIEYDTTILVSQYKYVGCLFMATNNTPCEIWGPILQQITNEINEGGKELIIVIVPISTVDVEFGKKDHH